MSSEVAGLIAAIFVVTDNIRIGMAALRGKSEGAVSLKRCLSGSR
jgi:hypothetical protein